MNCFILCVKSTCKVEIVMILANSENINEESSWVTQTTHLCIIRRLLFWSTVAGSSPDLNQSGCQLWDRPVVEVSVITGIVLLRFCSAAIWISACVPIDTAVRKSLVLRCEYFSAVGTLMGVMFTSIIVGLWWNKKYSNNMNIMTTTVITVNFLPPKCPIPIWLLFYYTGFKIMVEHTSTKLHLLVHVWHISFLIQSLLFCLSFWLLLGLSTCNDDTSISLQDIYTIWVPFPFLNYWAIDFHKPVQR